MTETDIAYWIRRAGEEREKAELASNPAGYRIHTEFARLYERKVQQLIAFRSVSDQAKGETRN
jgi:hypothetical protein